MCSVPCKVTIFKITGPSSFQKGMRVIVGFGRPFEYSRSKKYERQRIRDEFFINV